MFTYILKFLFLVLILFSILIYVDDLLTLRNGEVSLTEEDALRI